MKLHTESAACRARASCADCQDPGVTGIRFRLTRRAAGYTDLPADGAVLPCPWGQNPPPLVTADSGGPGTELKNLLARLGFKSGSECACNRHARQMNEWGVRGCDHEDRIAQIVDWLDEEARTRGVPFSRLAARLLVRTSIRRARKAEIRRGQGGEG